MRNVKDGDALFAQTIDDTKEAGHLGFGEGAGRLIHDENVGFQRQGFGDLHQLLIADAQLADQLPGMNVAFELHEQVAGRSFHGAVVEQAEGFSFFATEENVSGRR